MNFELEMAEKSVMANRCIFVNCLGQNTLLFETLLKEFTGDNIDHQTQPYVWSVDNKYYSTKIVFNWCELEDNFEAKMKGDSCEALVVVTDCLTKESPASWIKVSSRLCCQDSFPSVCILLAVQNTCSPEPDRSQELLKWCVENRFEMIEWTPGEKLKGMKGQEAEEEEAEEGGIARLAEALQAHVWPVMTMKHNGNSHVQEQPAVVPDTSTGCSSKGASLESTMSAKLSEVEETLAAGVDGEQDPGGESFEQLFAKFADMKAHAQQLSHDERKNYAEKVVLAFWNAIGGDEDEVKDFTN